MSAWLAACLAAPWAFAAAPPRLDPALEHRPQQERLSAVASAGTLPNASTGAVSGISTDERRRGLMLVDLFIEEVRLEEAEALAVKGLEVDVDTGPWTMRLARVRIAQNRLADAAALYERLLSARADDAGLLLQLGELSFAIGDVPRARRAFLKARDVFEEPVAPYYLSEIGYAEGSNRQGRKWADVALSLLKDAKDPSLVRMRLHLQARLGWRPEFDDEFGKLYDSAPRESETLAEWASVLIDYRYLAAAVEPIQLLRERFAKPSIQARWRHLEAERLRAAGDRKGLRAHLDDSVRAMPAYDGMRMARAELAVRERAWPEAESDLRLAGKGPYEKQARDLTTEVIRQSHRRAGPLIRWRETKGTSVVETGAALLAYPARRWRLEAEADRGVYRLKSRGEERSISGMQVSLAREWADWTLGADADVRSGGEVHAVSPGAFFHWRGGDTLFVDGKFAARRAWLESVEAGFVGATSHEGSLSLATYPMRRLYVGAQVRMNRASLPSGGSATQRVLTPEAVVTLLNRPLYVGLGYRYSMVNASGDNAFFARLPLVEYARTQYAVLSFGKHWCDGRVRSDGYVYNGHDPARGRRFGTGALIGLGGSFEWILGRRWRLAAGYELTREDNLGVGGKSEAGRLSVEWRFPPAENKS